jgi:DNA invertase Pin-like site-specific DNA recombinase
MDPHRRALEELARALGLEAPSIYLDNGTSSSEQRPQLRRLLARASVRT